MNKKLLTLFCLLSCSCYGFAQSKTQQAVIKTAIYCDHCLKCESCGDRLENAIYALKGVKRVEIADKKNEVKVIYQPARVNLDQIRQSIARSGFDADEVKADPAAVEKLDDCCRKQ